MLRPPAQAAAESILPLDAKPLHHHPPLAHQGAPSRQHLRGPPPVRPRVCRQGSRACARRQPPNNSPSASTACAAAPRLPTPRECALPVRAPAARRRRPHAATPVLAALRRFATVSFWCLPRGCHAAAARCASPVAHTSRFALRPACCVSGQSCNQPGRPSPQETPAAAEPASPSVTPTSSLHAGWRPGGRPRPAAAAHTEVRERATRPGAPAPRGGVQKEHPLGA